MRLRRYIGDAQGLRLAARESLKLAAARAGYDVHRRDHSHPARRAAAIGVKGIDVVIDVGANEGQYVRRLREFGYTGRVVSFEPYKDAFTVLEQRFRRDGRWRGFNAAVGERERTVELRVSESSLTSSLLEANDDLRSRIPAATVEKVVSVPMVALDDVWPKFVSSSDRPMLKIDVQGYEHGVLDGGAEALQGVELLEVEMALIPLYEGGSTLYNLLPRLHDAGFSLVSVDPGFVDLRNGQVLDVDVLLARSL